MKRSRRPGVWSVSHVSAGSGKPTDRCSTQTTDRHLLFVNCRFVSRVHEVGVREQQVNFSCRRRRCVQRRCSGDDDDDLLARFDGFVSRVPHIRGRAKGIR